MFAILPFANNSYALGRRFKKISAFFLCYLSLPLVFANTEMDILISKIQKSEKTNDKSVILKIAEQMLEKQTFDDNQISTDKDIDKYFYIFRKASFYFPDRTDFVEKLETLFEAKKKINLIDANDKSVLLRSYVEARMFKKAKEFSEKYALDDYWIPEEILSPSDLKNKKRVFFISADKRKLILKNLDLRNYEIAIIFSPSCSATDDAVKFLLANKELAQVIKNKTVFLTRKYAPLEVEEFKKKFILKEVYTAFNSADFEFFYFYSYPKFYFLKDGVVKKEIRGFSSDEGGKPFLKRFKEYLKYVK